MKIEDLNKRLSHWPIPSSVREQLKAYAAALNEKELPIIFEFSQLASLTKVPDTVLADIVNRDETFYREFSIPKWSGGVRKISIPAPTLMCLQRWILTKILSKLAVHDAAYGFVEKRSIKDNAEQHVGNAYLLKADVKDFFPSIKLPRIISVFKALGYSPQVSYYLAKICTYEGGLPQGAPTSPKLSNLVSINVDRRITALCNNYNLTYTRYADDLTISGAEMPNFVRKTVFQILQEEGFHPNLHKTRIYKPKDRKIVTGIVVCDDAVKLPKKIKKKLQQQAYYIGKYGLISHLENTDEFDPIFLERLLGRINFWLMIEPENPRALEAVDIIRREQIKLDNMMV